MISGMLTDGIEVPREKYRLTEIAVYCLARR
jgi:hypothetical protein